MSLNNTPSAQRTHIAFFGCRNAGKSSLINAVTGQNLAIVSEVKGTTTDPVEKTMELLPLGPVRIIDTPGIDDEGELGLLRIQKTRQVLDKTDLAVLVVDGQNGTTSSDRQLLTLFQEKNIPYLVVYNKKDLWNTSSPEQGETILGVSAVTGEGIHELKERMAALAKQQEPPRRLFADLADSGDLIILVTPIDSAAPKGRLILPQQQAIRDLLEIGALSVVTQVPQLAAAIENLPKPPRLVVTDSQAFQEVAAIVPDPIPLTSFSILFARYKGLLSEAVKGAKALDNIRTGDRILIAEGCTHHRQCEDIGTVKLPNWIRRYTGAEPEFSFTSGGEFPQDLRDYQLIVHCGGCMLNQRQMQSRLVRAMEQGAPMTNYGVLISYLHGILPRCIAPLPELAGVLEWKKK